MTQLNAEQRAYKHLRGKLKSGAFLPGSRISALAVAGEIGSSPTPVTQAIRKLESEGLIELVPNLGSFVKNPSPKEVCEIFELREAIEPYATALSIGRLTEPQLGILDKLCQALARLQQRAQGLDGYAVDEVFVTQASTADLGFHALLVRTTGNARMLKMIEDLHILARDRMLVHGASGSFWASDLAVTFADHTRILDAVRRGDRAGAALAAGDHLRAGKQRYIAAIEAMNHRGVLPPEILDLIE